MKLNKRSDIYKEFDRLYQEYCGRIYNFAFKLTRGDIYKSEEITQITFQKLWEKINEGTAPDHISSYLFATAKNTILNIANKEALQYIYNNYLAATSQNDNSTENEIDSKFMMEFITNLINDLPQVRQRVFRMSRMQHMSHKQIAQELNISERTVENHIAIVLRMIREQFGRPDT